MVAASNVPSSNSSSGSRLILDCVRVEPAVGGELVLIHPDPDHPAIDHFRWEIANPATHEIENRSASRQQFPVQLRHAIDRNSSVSLVLLVLANCGVPR
jgi:hypothetical protein